MWGGAGERGSSRAPQPLRGRGGARGPRPGATRENVAKRESARDTTTQTAPRLEPSTRAHTPGCSGGPSSIISHTKHNMFGEARGRGGALLATGEPTSPAERRSLGPRGEGQARSERAVGPGRRLDSWEHMRPSLLQGRPSPADEHEGHLHTRAFVRQGSRAARARGLRFERAKRTGGLWALRAAPPPEPNQEGPCPLHCMVPAVRSGRPDEMGSEATSRDREAGWSAGTVHGHPVDVWRVRRMQLSS